MDFRQTKIERETFRFSVCNYVTRGNEKKEVFMRKFAFVFMIMVLTVGMAMAQETEEAKISPYIGIGLQRFSPTIVTGAYLRLEAGAELRLEGWAIFGEFVYLTGKGDNEWGDLINTNTHFALGAKYYVSSFHLGSDVYWGDWETDYADYGAPSGKTFGFEVIMGGIIYKKMNINARVGKEKLKGEYLIEEKYTTYSVSVEWFPFK